MGNSGANGREFDEYNVAQGFLSIVSDGDGAEAILVIEDDSFVLRGVLFR